MVPASSLKVPRASSYSGSRSLHSPFAYTTLTSYGRSFQYRSARLADTLCGPKPHGARTMVWALPRSLAATCGIILIFSSSGYLDVSVHRVPSVWLWIRHTVTGSASRVSPVCGSPWLFAAYHVFLRLSVPRHPPCALSCLTFVVPYLRMAWFSRCIPLMAIHEVPAFPHLSRQDTDESSMLSHLCLLLSQYIW